MFDMKKIIALALAVAISVPSAVLAKEAESASVPETLFANEMKSLCTKRVISLTVLPK